MMDLDKETFDSQVLGSKGIILVDFWSESCESCLDMMPEIEALEHELNGRVSFARVNIQGNRRLAIREKVLGLPTVAVYQDGRQVASFSKEFTAAEVKAAVEELAGGKGKLGE